MHKKYNASCLLASSEWLRIRLVWKLYLKFLFREMTNGWWVSAEYVCLFLQVLKAQITEWLDEALSARRSWCSCCQSLCHEVSSPLGSVVVETECVMHLICICGVPAISSISLSPSLFMEAPHASVLPALQNSNVLPCLLRFMIRDDTFGPSGTSFQELSRRWHFVGKFFLVTLKIMTS